MGSEFITNNITPNALYGAKEYSLLAPQSRIGR